jgi:hypothetical protein
MAVFSVDFTLQWRIMVENGGFYYKNGGFAI